VLARKEINQPDHRLYATVYAQLAALDPGTVTFPARVWRLHGNACSSQRPPHRMVTDAEQGTSTGR
jgi:hypothetical protein